VLGYAAVSAGGMHLGRARALAAGAVLAFVTALRAIVSLHRVNSEDLFAPSTKTVIEPDFDRSEQTSESSSDPRPDNDRLSRFEWVRNLSVDSGAQAISFNLVFDYSSGLSFWKANGHWTTFAGDTEFLSSSRRRDSICFRV